MSEKKKTEKREKREKRRTTTWHPKMADGADSNAERRNRTSIQVQNSCFGRGEFSSRSRHPQPSGRNRGKRRKSKWKRRKRKRRRRRSKSLPTSSSDFFCFSVVGFKPASTHLAVTGYASRKRRADVTNAAGIEEAGAAEEATGSAWIPIPHCWVPRRNFPPRGSGATESVCQPGSGCFRPAGFRIPRQAAGVTFCWPDSR